MPSPYFREDGFNNEDDGKKPEVHKKPDSFRVYGEGNKSHKGDGFRVYDKKDKK